jgi:hypothetical protein
VNWQGQPLACDHCEVLSPPYDTLCPTCDTPNPWARRDTLHFWCRECGTTQMFLSHAFAG